MACFLGYFFFSSRRRHTRCLSDWSSDVCSSDLEIFSRTADDEQAIALPEFFLDRVKRVDRFAATSLNLVHGRWIVNDKSISEASRSDVQRHGESDLLIFRGDQFGTRSADICHQDVSGGIR